MPDVFTAYSCGTAFNRDNKSELIADLALRTGGKENRDWMINDGPGSAPGGPDSLERGSDGVMRSVQNPASTSKAVTPGTVDPVTGARTPSINPAFVENLSARLRGLISGYGWGHNVVHTLAVIERLSPKPTVVNLAGWSRGAVTCHMIANAIHEQYGRAIEVNIFAVDPVPGGSHSTHDQSKLSIPPCVAHYQALLAIDDRKLGFKPAVVEASDCPDARFFPMPGIHDTVVTGAAELSGVAILSQHLADRFLLERGTLLSKPLKVTDVEICEFYAKIRRNQGRYEELGKRSGLFNPFGWGKSRTNIPTQRKGLEACDRYFINEHHHDTFQSTYPKVYALLFRTTPTQAQQASASFVRDFNTSLHILKQTSPNAYEQLRATGVAPHLEKGPYTPAP